MRAGILFLGFAAAIVPGCATHYPPGRCIDSVAAFENSPELRVQGGAAHQAAARDTVKVYLTQARMAAASGNEPLCWDRYSAAKSTLVY